ncbi:MAG: signal recognition particle-docking protein FtsY [Actinomycetia bacterium]|nr:signal recognition particle-docking protein FtsY [Actinomycetes bacterium]
MIAVVIVIVVAVLVLAGVVVAFTRTGIGRGSRSRELPGEAPDLTRPPAVPPPTKTPEAAAREAEEIAQLEEALRREAAAPAAPPEAEAPEAEAPEVVLEKPRLRDRLGRTRSALSGYLREMRGHKVDADTWDELEEALLLADVGVATTQRLLDAVRQRVNGSGPDNVVEELRAEVVAVLDGDSDRSFHLTPGEPNVWMFVGVNGVGKTTTIGKLAAQETAQGHRVLLAAADTFRAAAAEQLALWAERTGGEIVRGQEGADPGSVVFDAMSAAASRGADLVLVDTAGRLHTKVNLMEELKKLRRIVDRTEGALKEVLLVIDASTGQNGLVQAREFADAVDVTGIVLTKLDGTAKGGIVLAIQHELGLPVKAVGVGEGVGDLVAFDPVEFADALFND